MFSKSSLRVATAVVACAFTFSLASHAEVSAGSKSARALITQKIDETKLVTLDHNVSPRQTAARDRGPVEESLHLNHIFVTLKRTPEQQAALVNFLARQQQKGASEYHQWLTPQQFGDAFGTSDKDIATVEAWLESKGFHVNNVPHSGHYIDVAGDPQAIRDAFHTELHYYIVRGKKVFGNVNDPQIPAALAPVIAGITGLRNGVMHPNFTSPEEAQIDRKTGAVTKIVNGEAEPNYTDGATIKLVLPQDEYRIYGELALLNASTPINGTGATVAVLEQADMAYGTVNSTTGQATGGDLANWRTLAAVPGTLNFYVFHGYGSDTCTDPGTGTLGTDEFEATIDAEWANATAPSAKLIFMSCDDTTDDGIFTSMQAVIDNNLADSMSLSYGESEINLVASDYTYLDGLYQAAAAQGQTIAISTGDGGSASDDQFVAGGSTHGINVSGFATSPYILASGGTDFQDLYDADEGGKPVSTYWNSTNSATGYWSAIGYVPEAAWNDTCAGSLITKYKGYTGAGYCATKPSGFTTNGGGTGGFSTHYTVPAYQNGITGYSGTMRAVPDVSLFAADDNSWSRGIIGCDSQDGGSAQCTTSFYLSGGTSFVAPQMAGMAALLRQSTGTRQGTLNYAIYALAKAQMTGTLATSCYANGQTSNTGVTVSTPNSACIFNDVTTDNNDQYCKSGSTSCYVNAGKTAGMLSLTGTSSLTVAYPSAAGYDEVTGIGSVNIANLVNGWKNAFSTNTALTATPTSITSATSTALKATVTASVPNGTAYGAVTGTVTFYAGTTNVGSCTISAGTCSANVSGATLGGPGSYSVTASYGGSSNYPASVSAIITVIVTDNTSTTVSANPGTITTAQTTVFTATVGDSTSGSFVPTGSVTFTEGSTTGTQVGSCTLSAGTCSSAAVSGATLGIGTDTVYANYSGVTNAYNTSSGSTTVVVNPTGPANGYITFTSVSHNFGKVAVGTAATQFTLKVTNTGTAAYPFSLVFTPSNGFTSANNCGSSIAAGANCELAFYFTPTATGSFTTTWSLAPESGFGYTPSNGGTLQGQGGSAGGVSITTAGHNFGTVMVGTTSATYGTELSNSTTSAETLTIGTVSAPFHMLTNCAATLAAGSSCEIEFTYQPTTTSPVSTVVTLSGSPTAITVGGAALPNGGITLSGN